MAWAWRAVKRVALVLLVLFIAYVLLAVFALPLLVRRGLADWQAQTPGVQVQLGSIAFNPVTLTLRATGFRVSQAGQPLLSVDKLKLRLSISSLPRRAVVLDDVILRGAALALQWDAQGHLNLEKLLPQQHRQRQPQSGGSVPWQIDHLAFSDLRLSVIDPAVGLTDALQVGLPSLELDHIGTLHGGDDSFALDLHGRYDGKAIWNLHWKGDVDFAPLSSAGRIELSKLSLPWLDESLGHRLPVKVEQGELDAAADYQLDDVQGQQRLLLQKATLDLRTLRLSGKERPIPTLALRQLHVGASRIDTLRHTVLGESLLVDAPELLLHRDKSGQFDVLRLLPPASKARTPAPAVAAGPAWSVTWPLAEVRSANVQFEDEQPKGFGNWRVEAVDLRLHNVQTLNDTPLQFEGHGLGIAQEKGAVHGRWSVSGGLLPQSGGLQAKAEVKGLDLTQANVVLAQQGKIQIKQGELAAQLSIVGNIKQPANAAVVASAQLTQADLLAPQWGEVRGQQLALGPLHYQKGKLTLDALHAQGWHVSQADRTLDLSQLDASGGNINLSGPQLQLKQLQLAGLKADSGAGMGPHITGQQAQLSLSGLSWNGSRQQLALAGLQLTPGTVSLQNAGKTVQWGWQQLSLQTVAGDVGAQRWSLGGLSGQGWSWQGHRPWVSLPQISLGGAQVNVVQHTLALGPFSLSGGQVTLLRRKDGGIQPLTELQAVLAKPGAAATTTTNGATTTAKTTVAAAGPAWQVTTQGVDIALSSVQLIDGQKQIPLLPATDFVLKAGPWSSTGGQPLQEHVQLTLDKGQLQWDGTVNPQPLAVAGQLSVQGLDLSPLQPLLAQSSYAGIDHGTVSTSGKVSVTGQGSGMKLHYDGSAQAGDTRLVDVRDGQPVLTWSSVSVPQLTLDWPGDVNIPGITLAGLTGKVIIQPDHRVNWETLMKPAPATAAAPAPAPAATTTPAATPPAAPFPVHIGQITLTGGAADYADDSLLSPFEASLHDLAGSIGPIATDAPQDWTNITLKGKVNTDGYMQASGRIMPLAKPLRLEMGVHFKDIQLPTLNPYAAEFAGYRIDQGMLDLQLQYTLDQGKIIGSNKARIDQIELGQQVHSAGAPDLPLRAMIALLRNDAGVIDLDVPVQGDLNDPSLTMRDIVFKALGDVLRNALESPFSLVASLLGSDADTLRHIGFVPGTVDLSAHDLTKLQSIAQVLTQHQNMLVFILPSYNPGVDGVAPAGSATVAAGSTAGTGQATAGTAADGRSAAPGAGSAASGTNLRALALQRAEAIKTALKKAGIKDHRIFIAEPDSLNTVGKLGTVLTTLDIKVP